MRCAIIAVVAGVAMDGVRFHTASSQKSLKAFLQSDTPMAHWVKDLNGVDLTMVVHMESQATKKYSISLNSMFH